MVKEFPGAFAFGIIHIRENGKKSGGHWVAVAYGEVWDGNRIGPMLTCDYAARTAAHEWHITAYLPVTWPANVATRWLANIHKANTEKTVEQCSN